MGRQPARGHPGPPIPSAERERSSKRHGTPFDGAPGQRAHTVHRQDHEIVPAVPVKIDQDHVEHPCGQGAQAIHRPPALPGAHGAGPEHRLQLPVDGPGLGDGEGPGEGAALEDAHRPHRVALQGERDRERDGTALTTHGAPRAGQSPVQVGPGDLACLALVHAATGIDDESQPPRSGLCQTRFGGGGEGVDPAQQGAVRGVLPHRGRDERRHEQQRPQSGQRSCHGIRMPDATVSVGSSAPLRAARMRATSSAISMSTTTWIRSRLATALT